MTIPAVEEIFNRPYTGPLVPTPQAWIGDSVAVELADRECARLLVNHCLYDPPITDAEIKAYAKRFNIPERQAELERRRRREKQ